MDQTNMPILTPYNYFEWKSHMTIYLRKAELNRITMGLETEPDKDEDKPKWFNNVMRHMEHCVFLFLLIFYFS